MTSLPTPNDNPLPLMIPYLPPMITPFPMIQLPNPLPSEPPSRFTPFRLFQFFRPPSMRFRALRKVKVAWLAARNDMRVLGRNPVGACWPASAAPPPWCSCDSLGESSSWSDFTARFHAIDQTNYVGITKKVPISVLL